MATTTTALDFQPLVAFVHPRATDLNVLTFNDEGVLLAGMGDGSAVLWEVSENRLELGVQVPGAVTSSAWLVGVNGSSAIGFVLGCDTGKFYIYGRGETGWDRVYESEGERGALEAMAWDHLNRRLAVAAGGKVKLFAVDRELRATVLECTPERPAVPRFVSFINDGRDLLVAYLQSHELCHYQVSPFVLRWSAIIPTRIGHATLTADSKNLIVYNLANGVDLYEMPVLPGVGPSQSFPFSNSLQKISTVGSAKYSDVIVCGGPDGRLNVFSQRSGLRVASLPVGVSNAFVEVVAAHTLERSTILAAGCKIDGQVTVRLWESPLFAELDHGQHQETTEPQFRAWLRYASFFGLYTLLAFGGVVVGTGMYHALQEGRNLERA